MDVGSVFGWILSFAVGFIAVIWIHDSSLWICDFLKRNKSSHASHTIRHNNAHSKWRTWQRDKRKKNEGANTSSATAFIGRELTDNERAYFILQGFQDINGWRKIETREYVLQWIYNNFTHNQFERFCVSVLNVQCGGRLRATKKRAISNADGGCDGEGEILINGVMEPVAMEAKMWTGQVGEDVCQKLVGVLVRRGWKKGYVITTGTFSERAWASVDDFLRRGIQIVLVDQDGLLNLLLRKTMGSHGYGFHQTDEYGLLYMNQEILRRAAE